MREATTTRAITNESENCLQPLLLSRTVILLFRFDVLNCWLVQIFAICFSKNLSQGGEEFH